MNNVLTILFAVLDCNAWSISQIISWSDGLISRLDHPRAWLIDLSVSNSVDDCLDVIREAMREFGLVLPENVGDLMAGLILLRFDNGELSSEDAIKYLADVVDAYEGGCVDAEAAGMLSLNDPVYSEIRKSAEFAVKYLTSEQLLETERRLVED